MAGKDIAEKTLEGYNEVFADIVNVLLFGGEQIISPDDLVDQIPRSSYKTDGKLRELERDVAKRWVRNNIRIACIGLENQTQPDRYMPLRIAGYDGLDYRSQLRELKPGEKPCPVITLVLYFGYQGHWKAPRSLIEALEVPDFIRPYVNDVKVNLFEIAYLTWDQVNLFRSDFREVARYFVQMRESGEYVPSDDELRHIESVLQLMNVMDRDHRFETVINERKGEKEVRTMSEWLSRVINTSEARGEARGITIGEARGEARGITIGEARGEEKGRIMELASLVKDQIITISEAAKRMKMTESEFCKKAGISLPQ